MVLLDGDTLGIDMLSTLEDLRTLYPTLPTVILSAHKDPGQLMRAFERGAKGYIAKTTCSDALLQALRVVLSGGVYISPEFLMRLNPESALNTDTAGSI